jgi:hypothetical protein
MGLTCKWRLLYQHVHLKVRGVICPTTPKQGLGYVPESSDQEKLQPGPRQIGRDKKPAYLPYLTQRHQRRKVPTSYWYVRHGRGIP